MNIAVGEGEITIRIKRLTKTIHIAAIFSILSFFLITIALFTPNWIEGDQRLYNNPFDKLGLWTFCFRSFTDPLRRYPQYFASCRWFLDYEIRFMRDVLAPPFFVVVQFSYGFGYVLLILNMIILALFWLQVYRRYGLLFLYTLSFLHAAAGFWFFVAYTTFGIRAYDPSWLPGWHNNYLSWSFGLAIVGGLIILVCSFLYYTEAMRVENEGHSPTRLTSSERLPETNGLGGPRQSLIM